MIKFTFGELNEKAEAFKNYKLYVWRYWNALREKEPDGKIEYHKSVLAERFGVSVSTIQKIIYNKDITKVTFSKPIIPI